MADWQLAPPPPLSSFPPLPSYATMARSSGAAAGDEHVVALMAAEDTAALVDALRTGAGTGGADSAAFDPSDVALRASVLGASAAAATALRVGGLGVGDAVAATAAADVGAGVAVPPPVFPHLPAPLISADSVPSVGWACPHGYAVRRRRLPLGLAACRHRRHYR
jgi:hypothetical protein